MNRSHEAIPSTPQNTRITSLIDSSNKDIDLAISPSKALAHIQSTQIWSELTDWLSNLISTTNVNPDDTNLTTHQKKLINSIERNEETQAWLLQAMKTNREADRTKELIHQARLEELRDYRSIDKNQYSDVEDDQGGVLTELGSNLGDKAKKDLDSLARACILLGYIPSKVESEYLDDIAFNLARAVFDLTKETQRYESMIFDISNLKKQVVNEITQSNASLAELENDIPSENQAEKIHAQTSQWMRETKQIGLKVVEYKERIASLERMHANLDAAGVVKIEDVITKKKIVEQLESEVRGLEENLREFHGLPPDIEVSRAEVKRAQAELDHWKRKRQELFEEMGAG